MGVYLDAYRASIGCFAMCLPSILRKMTLKKHILMPSRVISSRFQAILALSLVIVLSRLLVLAGDVEVNSGPSGRQQRAVNSSHIPVRHTPSSDSVSPDLPLGLPSSLPTTMDIMDELRGMRAAFDSRLDSLTAALDVKIRNVETILSTVQSDVVSLANCVAAIESTRVGSGPSTTSVVSDVLRELRLRESKQNNIIISGLRNDALKDDQSLVIDLFDEMGFSIFPKEVKRIGKSHGGKPALLLVVLLTHDIRQTVVNNAKRLRK